MASQNSSNSPQSGLFWVSSINHHHFNHSLNLRPRWITMATDGIISEVSLLGFFLCSARELRKTHKEWRSSFEKPRLLILPKQWSQELPFSPCSSSYLWTLISEGGFSEGTLILKCWCPPWLTYCNQWQLRELCVCVCVCVYVCVCAFAYMFACVRVSVCVWRGGVCILLSFNQEK